MAEQDQVHPLPEVQLAAAAFAQGRVARRALSDVVVPLLGKTDRELACVLIAAIDKRLVIQDSIAWDLDMLIETLEAQVEGGTTRTTVWSDYDCDMSGGSYTETHRTDEALALAGACRELRDLQEAIAAVLDRVHARQAVENASRALARRGVVEQLAIPQTLR